MIDWKEFALTSASFDFCVYINGKVVKCTFHADIDPDFLFSISFLPEIF